MPCVGSKCYVLDLLFEEEKSNSRKTTNFPKNHNEKFLKDK